uniref:WW domain-containing protein n=1 Tax=Aureoumbra lagunensis TaxID=44058 RepID=A0A7S3K083_9STRA
MNKNGQQDLGLKWERVLSRSRKKYYWRRGKESQWHCPEAIEFVQTPKTPSNTLVLRIPLAIIHNVLLNQFCDAISVGRFCASCRHSFLLASADDVWFPHRINTLKKGKSCLRIFGQEPSHRTKANMRVDKMGKQVYRQIIDQEIRALLQCSDQNGGNPSLDRILTDLFLTNCARDGLLSVQELQDAASIDISTAIIKPTGILRALRNTRPSIFPTLPPRLFTLLHSIDKLGPNTSPELVLNANQAALSFCVAHSSDIQRCFNVNQADHHLQVALSFSPRLRDAVDNHKISLYQLLRMTPQSRSQYEAKLSASTLSSRIQAAIASRFRAPIVQLNGNPFTSDWF